MRIVLDGRFYRASTGGIGRYTRELIKYLAIIDKTNQYTVILTPEDRREYQLKASNFEPLVTDIRHFTLAEQFKLPSLLRQQHPDVTHFLNFNHPLNYQLPFITTIHDLTMTFFPVGRQKLPGLRQGYLWMMDHAAKAAAAVIVPSKTVKKDVEQCMGITSDRVQVIYEGAEVTTSSISSKRQDRLKKLGITKPYILFVSQWRPHKGLGMLVEAFNQLKGNQDIQLVATGRANPQFPEIPAAIEASPYRSDIITPGFVDDETLDILYAETELFIFPSWYEGFGLPPLEAMARGVPVASSNTSVMPEILGSAAAYFDPRQPQAIAETIRSALADKQQLAELKKRGLAQAQGYSWQKMAEQTLKLYELIAHHP